ncbi:HGC1 [Candida pseudojiufengensis]|uniref:HGC1 n=1 Tax=Candida pseudojiufengensis TaxID=497109 RepID=UPI002224EC11|nr:HGC1 [Candida pseudojiufengensis]KAI5961240.1 HGC1 [Candida pseudojiufengensis]
MLSPKSISQIHNQQTFIKNSGANNNNSNSHSKNSEFKQLNYSFQLYKSECKIHQQTIHEYENEIYNNLINSMNVNKPNLQLYKQQPYLTFNIRLKLIDFLLKMSQRLKILPFVYFKSIKLFDKYCSKRIVLLDQSQLIITTCLWIVSKLIGGNNHFINLNNIGGGNKNYKIINDLGYGSGGKFLGPTERFRLPKLFELIKLCGNKCNYDINMFKQMELHILNTLEWNLNDPSIEEFLINSEEFNILGYNFSDVNDIEMKQNNIFKIKEYLSYVSLYSNELIDVNIIELSQVIMDLINEIHLPSLNHNTTNSCNNKLNIKMDFQNYKFIKKNLIKSILKSSDFILKYFDSFGPQYIYQQINNQYNLNISSSLSYDLNGLEHTNRSSSLSSSLSSTTSSSSATTYKSATKSSLPNIESITPPTPYIVSQLPQQVKKFKKFPLSIDTNCAVAPQIQQQPVPFHQHQHQHTQHQQQTQQHTPLSYKSSPIPPQPNYKFITQQNNNSSLSLNQNPNSNPSSSTSTSSNSSNNSPYDIKSIKSSSQSSIYSIDYKFLQQQQNNTPISENQSPIFANLNNKKNLFNDANHNHNHNGGNNTNQFITSH